MQRQQRFWQLCLQRALLVALSACAPYNAGTHNQSKGICQNIAPCREGQCKSQDSMTQTHCEMLEGEFTPNAYQSKRWWIF